MKRLLLGILVCLLLSVGVSAADVEALYINCTVQADGAAGFNAPKAFGEAGEDEKNAVSHRGRALAALRSKLCV